MQRVRLIVQREGRLLRTVLVERSPFLIGRGTDCDLVLDHPQASRRHARITLTGGAPLLLDDGSANGLVVDGRRVRDHPIATGDALAIGAFTLQFEVLAASTPGAERSSAALEGLLAVAADLGGDIDQEELLRRLLDWLIRSLEAERGFVLGSAGEELVPLLSRGTSGCAPDPAVSRSIAREVARTGEPALIRDVEAQARFAITPSIEQGGIRSILCVPIRHEGHIEGVLYLDSPVAAREFAAADLDVMRIVAGHAARFLAAHRTIARLRISHDRLAAIERSSREGFERIVAASPAMRRVLDEARRAAASDVSCLIRGETGTGKEVLARAIHAASARRDRPFVAVNCAALAPGIVESELYGHAKGAFTGALERRIGRFEMADGGTFFLDEVGDLPPAVQLSLLRVLEERTVTPVGGDRPVAVDVRLICATHVDLESQVACGGFRADLYYRINVLALVLPRLKERLEDIPELVDRIVRELAGRGHTAVEGVEADALAALLTYPWPGNVRELRNVIERALVLEPSRRITLASLPFAGTTDGDQAAGGALDRARMSTERALIVGALRRAGGNVSAAAEYLGTHRSNLHRRIDALGIDVEACAAEQHAEERVRLCELLDRYRGDLAAVAAALKVSRSTLYRRLKAHGLGGGAPTEDA